MRLAPALFALVLAGPALAGQTTACWTPGAAPGVFGWTATPAQACRDGRNVDGRVAATPVTPLPEPKAIAAGAEALPDDSDAKKPGTQVYFTGEAYVGIAVTF